MLCTHGHYQRRIIATCLAQRHVDARTVSIVDVFISIILAQAQQNVPFSMNTRTISDSEIRTHADSGTKRQLRLLFPNPLTSRVGGLFTRHHYT